MQHQNYNTAMRNAFAMGLPKRSGHNPLAARVLRALGSVAGMRSRAMWAPLNPVAYNPSCLAVKESR